MTTGISKRFSTRIGERPIIVTPTGATVSRVEPTRIGIDGYFKLSYSIPIDRIIFSQFNSINEMIRTGSKIRFYRFSELPIESREKILKMGNLEISRQTEYTVDPTKDRMGVINELYLIEK